MIKPIALTHICANYTYNHVLDVCVRANRLHECANVCTNKYSLFEKFSCLL